MTKKKELKEAEELTKQRLMIIKSFNMENAGIMWINPEKIPTKEDIEDAKKRFEDRTKALNDKKDYLIADKENAIRVIDFLEKFISNSVWFQRYFVGVLNFVNEFVPKFKAEYETEARDLVMDYPAMQFVFLMLENYGGIGIESAKHMAEIWEEYIPIYDVFKSHVEWYKHETEICKKLQNRWSMLEQGYYLLQLDDDAEAVNGKETNDTENDCIGSIEDMK